MADGITRIASMAMTFGTLAMAVLVWLSGSRDDRDVRDAKGNAMGPELLPPPARPIVRKGHATGSPRPRWDDRDTPHAHGVLPPSMCRHRSDPRLFDRPARRRGIAERIADAVVRADWWGDLAIVVDAPSVEEWPCL